MRRETERETGNGTRETWFRRAAQADAYLDRCARVGHPPRLTEKEYVAQFFEAKGKGVRCC